MLRALDAEGALRRRRHGRQQVKGLIGPAIVLRYGNLTLPKWGIELAAAFNLSAIAAFDGHLTFVVQYLRGFRQLQSHRQYWH